MIDRKEKVSIVVPIYNVEKFLVRCIDSIVNQTYSNLEIILVDDQSPDNCGAICDDYARKDDRIKVIHQENKGLSGARNSGIDIATGDYIAFIDSDDFIASDYVETLLDTLIKTGADIVQCYYQRFNNEDECKTTDNSNVVIKEYSSLEYLKNHNRSNVMTACNKLYKIALFSKIRYPLGKIHEDLATTYKVIDISNKVAVIDKILYYYYDNYESISKGKIKLDKLALIDIYQEQAEYFKVKGYNDLYVTACNNLALAFGTLISYKKDRYQDYDKFITQLNARYRQLRKVLKGYPLRFDLKICTIFSRKTPWLFKILQKLK